MIGIEKRKTENDRKGGFYMEIRGEEFYQKSSDSHVARWKQPKRSHQEIQESFFVKLSIAAFVAVVMMLALFGSGLVLGTL